MENPPNDLDRSLLPNHPRAPARALHRVRVDDHWLPASGAKKLGGFHTSLRNEGVYSNMYIKVFIYAIKNVCIHYKKYM